MKRIVAFLLVCCGSASGLWGLYRVDTQGFGVLFFYLAAAAYFYFMAAVVEGKIKINK